jgi:hypothetical protein
MASIFQNLLDNATFPVTKPGRAVSRAYQQISQFQAAKPVALTAANTAGDEVTDIATHLTTTSGGNYTISVNASANGITYTTASLAYNATAATIEAALDTASPATIVNGDIAVAEAGSVGLSDGNCSFTCSGNLASVPVLITATDVDLSGSGAGVGAVTRTTPGRKDRNAYQALFEMNIVDGAGNDAGESPAMTLPTNTDDYVGWWKRARLETIDFLCGQVDVEEGNTTAVLVRGLYNLPEALFGPH